MHTKTVEKPELETPFPRNYRYWKCDKTGLLVPKRERENLEWRKKLLIASENDVGMQKDLMSACASSLKYWVNAFVMTYHQFDVNPETGGRIEAPQTHVPFITWDIQDAAFDKLEWCLHNGKDILFDKSRDMGASWICVVFLHWLWLFRDNSQLLEMSRVREYVDQTGNMKTLFQKHDYINDWLPEWMVPPQCHPGQKHRTKMHMLNILNQSCIDGESTTEHAASGDRRLIILLDEFAKVANDVQIRSATRDAALMRIVNSTPSPRGAAAEYSKWKRSVDQIEVFVLPFYEHPQKGANRYVAKNELGEWEIRSPWFDNEEKIRPRSELAREVLRLDVEAGDVFFTLANVDKHIALYARPPKTRHCIQLDEKIPDVDVKKVIRDRRLKAVKIVKDSKGPLRVWCALPNGRPDQTKTYIIGIDISKGQGASESVMSVKCMETNEKIIEWRDATVPPYEMARVAVAIAIWIGGRKPRALPLLKWENNGPGWDFGRQIVKVYMYPYYYRAQQPGKIVDKKSQQYGFHTGNQSKVELLTDYDRALATGTYINHSEKGLEQISLYIHYPGGGVGPADLLNEGESARKTHGDIVIADALTIDNSEMPVIKRSEIKAPYGSMGWRKERYMQKNKKKGWRKPFSFV